MAASLAVIKRVWLSSFLNSDQQIKRIPSKSVICNFLPLNWVDWLLGIQEFTSGCVIIRLWFQSFEHSALPKRIPSFLRSDKKDLKNLRQALMANRSRFWARIFAIFSWKLDKKFSWLHRRPTISILISWKEFFLKSLYSEWITPETTIQFLNYFTIGNDTGIRNGSSSFFCLD